LCVVIVLGIIVALALFVVSGLWYREANARFSRDVLGYDLGTGPTEIRDFVRRAPGATSQVLRAWRTTSPDPAIERDRQLMTRRFRVVVSLVPICGLLPLVFGLLGQVGPLLIRQSLVGLFIFALAVALLLHRSAAIARVVVAYGNGRELDRQSLVISSLGVAAVTATLLVVLLLAVNLG